jgi:serpin B
MYLLDFTKTEASRKTINDWVADQTEQRIKDLLQDGSIDPDTALVLTNAIYFKASWLDKFDPAATKPGTFTAVSGARSVEMMHAEAEAQYAMVDGYQAVALPYISPDVGMLVVLPPERALPRPRASSMRR